MNAIFKKIDCKEELFKTYVMENTNACHETLREAGVCTIIYDMSNTTDFVRLEFLSSDKQPLMGKEGDLLLIRHYSNGLDNVKELVGIYEHTDGILKDGYEMEGVV